MAVSLLPMGAFAAPAAPETTNTIAEGAYTKEGTQWYVSFNDLETEADYIVIVSRSAEQPLAAENLVYLTETASTDTGTLTVPFRAAAEDIRYAVACRPGKIPESRIVRVNGGTADLERAARAQWSPSLHRQSRTESPLPAGRWKPVTSRWPRRPPARPPL